MVSLLEELERREAVIRERVSGLRFQKAELSEQWAQLCHVGGSA